MPNMGDCFNSHVNDTAEQVPRKDVINIILRRPTRSPINPPAIPENNVPLAMTRSEEHTSELQSLMRISYAVFCLNKKNKTLSSYVLTRTHTQHSQSFNE